MDFTDRIMLDGVRRTADGYLVAKAKAARTGIQIYNGDELGVSDMKIVRVYRAPEEVFADKAMQSYAHRPLTNDHPDVMVTADNWSKYAKGQTGGDLSHDATHVYVPLVMMDGAAIKNYESGKCELSMGYHADVVFEAGTTPDGEHYDAVQKNIRANHLALVDAGRAGPACRIGDGRSPNDIRAPHKETVMEKPLKTVLVDGLTIETTDQGAQIIDKLQKQIIDAVKAKDTAEGKIVADASAHKAALDAKDGEIAALKTKIPDAAMMDVAIAARGKLIDSAKTLIGDKADFSGKTDAEIRSASVAAKLGDAAVKDKSADYIAAAFDTLVIASAGQSGGNDQLRDAILHNRPRVTDAAKVQDAYDAKIERMKNAWKQPAAAA